MLKPVGSRCNMTCDYCYYQEKTMFYKDSAGTLLDEELLEHFVREYIESQTQREVLFTWHGGEPLLRPLSFYRKALELQRRYARGRHIDNCLQTNGTLLTPEWCNFFRENGFLIGISIDGPQHLHDAYRHMRATRNETRTGRETHIKSDGSSWLQAMRGIELLKSHGVMWNAMATVNRLNADHPAAFYHFFRDLGCEFLQFTPVVERTALTAPSLAAPHDKGRLTDFSVTPRQWGRFLCGIYDEWVRHDVGRLFIQTFDATLANWAGEAPGVCSLSPECGHAAVMEWNGDVYSCDHFVVPEYRLGNIREQTLVEMVYGQRQQTFGRRKTGALPRQCRECRWLFACHGECPKNRFVNDRYGNPGLNYLCEGYRQFFCHVAADMDFMTRELAAGRPPANIMLRFPQPADSR